MAHSTSPARQRERVLAVAYSLTNGDPDKIIPLKDLQSQVGIDGNSLKLLLAYCRERGWLSLSADFADDTVQMTIDGIAAAEFQALPWWRRWLSEPGVRAALLASVLTFLGSLLARLLLP